MLYRLARLLQLACLLLLPVAMAGNVADPDRVTLGAMLKVAGIGIGLFAVGWLLQQSVKPK